MRNKYFIYICLVLLFFLNSCSPVGVIATTTSAGAVVAESERSVGEAVDDIGIKIKITEKFIKSPSGIFLDVDTTVKLGTVLLTGIVENQEERIEAVKLVWEIEGVKEVINEVQIGNKQGIVDYAKDLWISTQVRAKTLNELGLDVVTYNFETINGRVHFMGVAKDAKEVEKIIRIIRSVKGVKEIANHIIIVD
jgi:osmotically-inducible protein OsmY